MKTKITLLIGGAVIATLSLSFATTARVDKKQAVVTKIDDRSAPAGGFVLEEK
jgi:hypothetical protein